MSGVQVEVKLGPPDAMVPRRAIVLYESPNEVFATVHDIAKVGSVPQLLAGKPLSGHTLRALRSKLVGSGSRRGVLPESVLAVDSDTLVWHEPPQLRHLAFTMSGQFASRSIGTVSGRVPCPGVVFVVRAHHWLVLAYKGRRRPVADTPLFHSPFFNVGKNHEICAGTVRKPESTAVGAIDAWSRAFFGSFFSHANFDGVVRCEGDATGLWRRLLKSPPRTFPARVLIDAGMTVGDLVARMGL